MEEVGNARKPRICIVAEFDHDTTEWIKGLRRGCDPVYDFMPVEVTLAGSSGVGAVVNGQPFGVVVDELQRIFSNVSQHTVRFQEDIGRFPNTEIFFMKPEKPDFFEDIHEALKNSKIRFEESPFPYVAHCTLYNGSYCENFFCPEDLKCRQRVARARVKATTIDSSRSGVVERISLYDCDLTDHDAPLLRKLFEIPLPSSATK